MQVVHMSAAGSLVATMCSAAVQRHGGRLS